MDSYEKPELFKYSPKKIVLCCDGTANEYALDTEVGIKKAHKKSPDEDGDMNTNVVKLFGYLEKNNPKSQIAYYDPGVGTWGPVFKKKAEQAIGWGISENIKEAYRYVMDRYYEGDEIYLFGFSRGAYTVRSLAGFINKCGLLTRGSENLVDYAFELYTTKNNNDIATGFKEIYSRPCKIYFIGVWDTVAALAPPVLYNAFHDTKLNDNVRFAYQALSLDERRASFKPVEWDTDNICKILPDNEHINGKTTKSREVQQVWFPGVHSDVGGSYRDDSLSNISLEWMLKKANEAGLELKKDGFPLPPNMSKMEREKRNIFLTNDEEKTSFPIIESSPNGLIHDETKNLPFYFMEQKTRVPSKGEIHPSAYEREKTFEGYKVNNPKHLAKYKI
jgi:uncharacterized protein (DUF2235 family)